MTRTSRTLNRVLLVVIGLTALAGAAAAVLGTGVLGTGPAPLLARAADALDTPATAAIAGAAGLAIAVLAVAVIATRGRGGTPTADTADGTDIAIDAVRDIVADRLRGIPAVISTRADAHRLRGRTVVTVTLSTRRRADLVELLARVRGAVDELDRILGAEPPLVVRVRSGWRASLARTQRAE